MNRKIWANDDSAQLANDEVRERITSIARQATREMMGLLPRIDPEFSKLDWTLFGHIVRDELDLALTDAQLRVIEQQMRE